MTLGGIILIAMSKILVPMATRGGRGEEVGALNYARIPYVRQLVERGLEPRFVSMLMTPEMIANAYRECSGLLCMGGGDIDARTYGHVNHPKNDRAEPHRDVVELALIRMAMVDRVPIFGICRGMQAIAVASGGTLHQHIPDIIEDEEHGIGEGNGYDALRDRARHVVYIDAGSRIAGIVGATEAQMNTGHHQAVATIGPAVRITGRSPGGIAEFLEGADPWHFCIGVQGHPEAQDDGVTKRLFDAFADVVRLQSCAR